MWKFFFTLSIFLLTTNGNVIRPVLLKERFRKIKDVSDVSNLQELGSAELRHVIALWRHGDRAPESYSAPEMASFFKYGPGQLTEEGIEHITELGRQFRRRYVHAGFLNSTFQNDQIYIRSPAVARCISSGICVGTGLFSEDKSFFPVPVFSEKVANDYLLQADFTNCARESRVNIEMCSQMRPHNQYKSFDEYITDHFLCTGWLEKAKYINTMEEFDKLDGIVNEYNNGVSQVNESYLEEALQIYAAVNNRAVGAYPYRNEDILRTKVGALINEIVETLNDVSTCTSPNDRKMCKRKISAYSTQDWIINAVAESLGFKERMLGEDIPQFTATILIELYEKDQINYVKVFYRTGWKQPQFLDVTTGVDGCTNESFCKFETFLNATQRFAVQDPKAYCGTF